MRKLLQLRVSEEIEIVVHDDELEDIFQRISNSIQTEEQINIKAQLQTRFHVAHVN